MKNVKKRLLIWGAALIVLAGAAAGGYFLLRTTDDALTDRELAQKGGTWLVARFDKGYGEHYYKVADVSQEPSSRPDGYKTNAGIRKMIADGDGDDKTDLYVYGKKHGQVYDLIAVDTVASQNVPKAAKAAEINGLTGALLYEADEKERAAAFYIDSFYDEVKIRVRVILAAEEAAEPKEEKDQTQVQQLIEQLAAQLDIPLAAQQIEQMLLQLTEQPAEGSAALKEAPAEAAADAASADPLALPDQDLLHILAQVAGHITLNPGIKLHPIVRDFRANFIDDNRYMFLWNGLLVTLEITLFSVLLGILIGVVVATVRSTWDQNRDGMHPGLGKAGLAVANKLCEVYLTVIRGTPVVIQLLIMYFIVFVSSNNSRLVAILAFGINSGAYVAEIIRGGIMSIDHGQLEAGRSLGFNYVQTMGYIVVPQALKNVLPALANEFIVLLKETSVVGYVAEKDLTKGGDIIRGTTHSAFMPLLAVAVIYLAMVVFFTWLVGKLERRLRSSDH